jgi:hypothetical protein
MSLHVRKEMTHYNEMNDKIFDIDMNVLDIARNVIKPFSFHLFHGQSDLIAYIGWSRGLCREGEIAEYEVLSEFLSCLRKELSLELNSPSQSVLPTIHHMIERLQRDFVKNLPDRSNHLVFPGEMLSFQVLFQVTKQKEVARCEVGEMRWLRHQDEAQFFNLFNGHFGGVWFGVVNMKVSCCCSQFWMILHMFLLNAL